jgi:V/A-type H+/Na+-transporting ATPase subunit I
MNMFAPEPMCEANFFVLEPDIEAVTAAIARMEIFQLEDAAPEGWATSPEWTRLADRYNSLSLRLGEMLSSLGRPPAQEDVFHLDLRPRHDESAIEERCAALEAKIQPWHKHLQEAQQELERLGTSQSQVELLMPLDVPVENLRQLQYQTVTVGLMPAENVSRVAAALFQIPFTLVPLENRKDRTMVLAASSQANAAILDRALKSAFFEPIPLPPEALGRPTQAVETLRHKSGEVKERIRELNRQRESMASGLAPEINAHWCRAAADRKLAEAIRRFPKHGQVFLISGWVPAGDVDRVKKTVETAAGHSVAMEVLKADPKRQNVPTLIRTPRWMQPFEELVTTFGLSSYNELDPTPVATASFLIMYGMMFGDIGHGALLFLSGLGLRRCRRDFGTLMAAAGASGVVFGLLYGTALGKPVFHATWLRPLEGMWTILIAAVAGGAVLLNIGFLLNLVNAWRSRDWSRLLLEKNGVVGIALYWCFLGGGLGVIFGVLPKSALWPVPALCAVLWLHQPLRDWLAHRRAALTGEALITGFFELFEAMVGYASNSLSFTRLGAFAVAHEVLSSLVMTYSTGRLGWIVLLLGTIGIVGFEGFIVGIQALRLEYYEFFGRFFEGSGKPFAPLSLQAGG